MQSRYLVALYSGFYMMFLVVGCKPRNRSQLLEKSEVSQSQELKIEDSEVRGIQSQASDALRTLEKIGPNSLKDAMCSISRVADSNGGNILRSIDGISFKAGANIPKLFGKGTGPIGFNAAAEYVWWFGKGDNQIEDHLFLLPEVGISKGDKSAIGTEVAIIYGCKGDAANYAGYFGSMSALGFGLNLGVNLYPMFENYYIDGLKSSIPGGIDDNKSLSHEQALQIITDKSNKLHSIVLRKLTASGAAKTYGFEPKMTNRTMKSILADARFNISSSSVQPSIDDLYTGSIALVSSLFDQSNRNLLLDSLAKAKSLTIQPNENRAFFDNVRGPSSLIAFSSFLDKIWGGVPSQDSRIDIGLAKQLYDLSGHLFVENRKNSDVYFNLNAESTDGPIFSSVGNIYLSEVESTLFANGGSSAYGCKRQRSRYPGSRWFVVYVNGTKMYADCYGFYENEILKNTGSFSNRIFMESDWQGMMNELNLIKDFFSDLEALRFALRHATIQLYDSFQSKRVVSAISTGGISRNQDSLLTGCNSVSITLDGLKNAASLNISVLKDGYLSFTNAKPTAFNFLSELKKLSSQGSYGVDVSYYYETYYQRQYSLKEALPFVKGVHSLKNIDCGN